MRRGFLFILPELITALTILYLLGATMAFATQLPFDGDHAWRVHLSRQWDVSTFLLSRSSV